jgi:serine/threonine protein kinase
MTWRFAPARPFRAACASVVPESAHTLGRYKLQRKIGSGAMGVVYEALDPKLNRPVAIKTIIKSHLDEEVSREYSVRFKEEAQAVARLNHPNIVQVYDFGEEGEVAFIVMEFIRGKDLKQCFDGNLRFEPREFVRMMCELLSALDYAHQSGIVHRDIKPANVMLDVQSRVKLMDFGVAKITDTERTHRTQLGTMVGTPSYMSPEQVQGLVVDHRSDLFSSGIVLYQFLTGQRPFTGGDWTLRKMIVNEDPVRPSQINTALSPEFDRVIARALAKAPESRYQSAADFGHALQRVFEGRPAEEEDDRTIMRPSGAPSVPPPSKPADPRATPTQPSLSTSPTGGSQEVEVEFWRSIKDSEDAEDFELYLQQFPRGAYAKLAERKIAKLRKSGTVTGTGSGVQAGSGSTGYGASDTSAETDELRRLEEEHRRQAEELARRQAEARKKAEAEARARREAEEKARREAEEKARREAEEKARREAEEKARREAEEKARREAEAREKARREAEERARLEAERIRRENEERTRREAEEKLRREAEEKARREAEARAKREAEEKARREADEKARLEVERIRRENEEKARLEAEAKTRREAEDKARREAEAKAKREAEERARREAEETARVEAERIRRDNEENARREAEAKARREAEAKARREAEAKAKREAEAKAKREAEARVKREAEEKARQEAEARARARHDELEQKRAAEQRAPASEDDLTVAVPVQKAPARPAEAVREELTVTVPIPVQNVPPQRRNPFIVPGVLGGLVVAGAVAAYFAMRSPEQPPVVAKQPPSVPKVDPQPVQPQADERAKREAEEKARAALALQREAESAAAQAKAEADAKAAKAKADADAKTAKAEADKLAKAKADAEAKARAEADKVAKAKADAEAKARAEADKVAKAKAEADKVAKAKADAEAKARAEAEAKAKADAEKLAKAKADEAKARAEAEAKAKAEADRLAKAEAEAKKKQEAEPKRPDGATLHQRALALENDGKVAEAVKLYKAAALANYGPSATRLGNIYRDGKEGVPRDYGESLKWDALARKLGEKPPTQKGR